MALRRNVLDAVDFIHPSDPAIKYDDDGYTKYVDSMFDKKHLTFVEGEEPTIFRIQQLTHGQKIANKKLPQEEQTDFVIRCGLISVQNYEIEKQDGTIIPSPQITRTKVGNLGDLIDRSWINDVNLPNNHSDAIAGAIAKLTEASTNL